MSTHRLDLSGARPLNTILNDPARTVASAPAKPGDDADVVLSGFRELRFAANGAVRIQRRRKIRKTTLVVDGTAVPGEFVEEPYEEIVVVIPGGATFFGRTSNLPADAEQEGPPPGELTPHIDATVRRYGDLHYLESGELVEEYVLREVIDFADSVGAEGKVED